MVSRGAMPPVSADVQEKLDKWVDELCRVAAKLLVRGDDDRDLLLAQISVATYVSLYAHGKVSRLADLAIEASASNRQLAHAAGITPQTANTRFPQVKRSARAAKGTG